MPPFRTSVVRLVAYRREEFLDRHEPHAPVADPRPFLVLLSPDTLQLVTASDADSQPGVGGLLQQVSARPDRTPRRSRVRPLALLHKLSHNAAAGAAGGSLPGSTEGSPTGGSATPRGWPAGAEELGGELDEGQVLTFSIALSQVADLERDERRIKVLFCRQRPQRSTESSDDWKAVWKAMAFPVAFPVEGWKHRNYSVKHFMRRHYRDPHISSVVLEADSPQEATALHAAMEEAIARLGQAVQWLAQDLPLDSKPVATLVTASSAGGGARGGAGGRAASGEGSPAAAAPSPGLAAAEGVDLSSERIVCPFPRLQQPLDVAVAGGWPAAGDAAAAGWEAEGGGKGHAAPRCQLAVRVWLHSPLGPAVATITEEQLRQSDEAGGAPVCVVAATHRAPPAAAASLEIIVQFAAEWRPAPPHRPSAGSPPPPAAGTSRAALAAVLAVPLLAAWAQLLGGGGGAPVRVLQSVAFLVSCMAALAAIVVLQLKARPLQVPHAAPVAEAPPPPAGWWRLTLLHAVLVAETGQSGADAPRVQRVVSSSPLPAAPTAALPLRLDGSAPELPPAVQRLVAAHPRVLSADVAARFVVGIGQADKAYEALRKMVAWVEAQGVVDLVCQPQPKFELIKRHYQQVFYCWSTQADCVLEVECTGRWRAAFEELRAAGVSERELLHHLFFCMEYAFRVLDTRPLPQGKTVKIIDLEGLTMRDVSSAAFKWYLQVGGALLAVNYPQRLHKAFLLNAPAWGGVIWKVLAAVIPRRTREQLQLFTKKQHSEAAAALLQWVPAEQLPEQYGGACKVPLGESELERSMLAYVQRLNERQQQNEVDQAEAAPPMPQWPS